MAGIRNIFSFLKDYNGLLNPVITEIDRQIWSYKLLDAPQIEELWSIYYIQDLKELKILEIERPELRPCPPPNKIIKEWIQKEWQKLDVESIDYKEKIIRESIDENGETIEIEEYFIDDEYRVDNFKNWIRKREEWRIEELPKREGLNLYNNLFKLYSDIKKESESVELMLGDGHIKWATEGVFVNHPVLLQKVNLKFNPGKPSFVITIEHDELKTELYTPMLRIIPSINQSMLPNIIQEAENIWHIADKENNIEFFKRLINVVDQNGKYVKDLNSVHNGPMIVHDPVVFLRKRTLGYSIFIDSIIEDIDKNGDRDFPQFFRNMVAEYGGQEDREPKDNDNDEKDWNHNGIDENILLTLPANNEQLKIMKYLDNYGAVLVQGPPGTGKTHTIANLIGHLLSEGKNVLVTSQTEKALTVLKEKVYEDLQNLCISLLSTSSQQKEMDATLFEIDEKTTTIDLDDSLIRIHGFEKERKNLIEKYKEKCQELTRVRNLDYKDIVFANETVTPIEAAKFINKGKGKYDYIPGESNDDTASIPLSGEELSELYESNGLLTSSEEKLLDSNLPDLQDIWDAGLFAMKVKEFLNCKAITKNWEHKIKINDDIDKESILILKEEGENIRGNLKDLDGFQLYIMAKGITDSVYVELWGETFEDYDALESRYAEYKKTRFRNDYHIPEELVNADTLLILDEIINTNKEVPVNKLASLIRPKWKRLQNSITNNSKSIETIEEYRNVRLIIDYELDKDKLIKQVKRLLGDFSKEADFESQDAETKLRNFMQKVQTALNWYGDRWTYYISKIKEYVTDSDKIDDLCFIDMDKPVESIDFVFENILIKELEYNYYFIQLRELRGELNSYKDFMKKFKAKGEPLEGFVDSIEEGNTEKYGDYHERIVHLYNKKDIHSNRIRLLGKLGNIAPDWANAIKNREGIHGNNIVSKDVESAWKWNQLNNQINRINSYDPNAIQREINRINEMLMRNARQLAYEKAWYYKIKNTTDEQTQAIKGWRQTMKQAGKRTGKNAPRLLKKARELMPCCQTAIPVWIMPLNRVPENFDPQRNKFDVVIIDEASQADLLTLSALYLGEKIIIVGDDEQVSPNPVGIKTHEMNALIEQHLQGIPLDHLYNEKTSIYDMAQSSGFRPLMLTEHFRCLPEIIEFSNNLSYNGKIKPLRDASRVSVKPAVIPYRVAGGYKSGEINRVEAEHIASLVCACIQNDEYKRKTIGVISLVGQEQAYEIDKLLQLKLDPSEYENRRIQCGNPAQFQGDERDIVFLSLVEGPREDGGPVRLVSESGRNDMYRRRYNVAASRAQDQMWVVYSLNPEIDLKPEDIRLRLIKHALNPSDSERKKQLNRAESDFEREVINRLQNKGYKVYSQWKIGSYRIDMVVEDRDKRIAIECDGDRWHTLDNLADDMKRQAILERLGWRFVRIRGSQFYRDPEETMEWVFNELDSYEIKPNYTDIYETANESGAEKCELLEEIKRQAEQIRIEWQDVSDDDEHGATDNEQTEKYEVSGDGQIVINDNCVKEEIEKEKADDRGQTNHVPIFNFAKNKSPEKSGSSGRKYTKPINRKENIGVGPGPLFDFRKK